MSGLTPKQSKALAFIGDYTAANGCSPTYREIATALGLKSVHPVHYVVHQLVDRGKVTVLPKRARSIEIVRAA